MPPLHLHTAFGIVFGSDRLIPGLPRAPGGADAGVRVHLGRMPGWLADGDASAAPWAPAARNLASGGAGVRIDAVGGGAWLCLTYADGTRFLLDRAGTELWAAWQGPYEDAASYLLGPVLGLLLRLRGVLALHASAVSAGGAAAALAGASGAGKSTLAAAFARAGRPVLGDDVAALEEGDGGFSVIPAHPQLRLWPDAAGALFGAADALPRLAPGWDKRCLDLSAAGAFAAAALPLAAVYVLGEGDGARVEPLAPPAALLALTPLAFAAALLDEALRRREFEALSRLVRAVPVRRLRVPDDPARADELVAAVVADVRALAPAAAREG